MLDTLYNGFSDGAYEPADTTPLREAMERANIREICKRVYNIFEQPILDIRPVAKQIKQIMLENRAIGAMMSGSGPSVFGIFESEKEALGALSSIETAFGKDVSVALCRPL